MLIILLSTTTIIILIFHMNINHISSYIIFPKEQVIEIKSYQIMEFKREQKNLFIFSFLTQMKSIPI